MSVAAGCCSSEKVALPLPWPSVPEPETATLHCAGGCLSASEISPSKLPPTEATFRLRMSLKRSPPSGIISLQPGMHFLSTAGSLSALHSVSIGTSKFSSPPMSSFMGCSCDLEQPCRQGAVERRRLRRRQAGLSDDLQRLAIGNRERHVSDPNQARGSQYCYLAVQHARVVQDGVRVHSAKPRDRVADAGRD